MDESSFIPYTATHTLPSGNVLVLAPHPDDEVFGCAGAIMQHLAQGDNVQVLILTDGSAATEHVNSRDRADYIELRRRESQQAAQILGYQELAFWNFRDRGLQQDDRLLAKLTQTTNKHHITRLYAPSVMEIHPDHYALAMCAVEVVRRTRHDLQLIQYEVGMPLHPNILLDISTVIERKKQAMACFHSQLRIQDYRRHILALNSFRSYTLPPVVRYAEAYYALAKSDLLHQPHSIFGPSRQTRTMNDANDELQRIQSILRRKEENLSTLYASTSWRATAALRFAGRIVKRFRKT